MATVLLTSALQYLDRGWSVIPVRGKIPAVSAWKPYTNRRATEAEVRDWIDLGSPSGIAVICGPVSGDLVVRDFDVLSSYEEWAAREIELARSLPTVQTPRGRHVYFSNGHQRITQLGDGELRGRGYCVLPPSVHPNGMQYKWLHALPNGSLPELDPFACGLADRVTEHTEHSEQTDSIWCVCEFAITDKNALAQIESAIETTLPACPGERNRSVFSFVRALKAIAAVSEADPTQLRPLVREWHRRALRVIQTKPFEETWLDFLIAWDRVRLAAGQTPMTLLEAAMRHPFPAVASRYEQEPLRRLIVLCRELQRLSGSAPFFLACRIAGTILGVDHNTAARWLRLLVLDGVLHEVAKGGEARTARRASRYRYIAPD